VQALRVADASVFPTLISGQLNAAVTVVALKAARMILAEHEAARGFELGDEQPTSDEEPGGWKGGQANAPKETPKGDIGKAMY